MDAGARHHGCAPGASQGLGQPCSGAGGLQIRRMQLPRSGGSGGEASAVARFRTPRVVSGGAIASVALAIAGATGSTRCGIGEAAVRASTLPPLQHAAVPLIVVAGENCDRTCSDPPAGGLPPPQCVIEAQTGTASRQASNCIATARVMIRMRRAAISNTGYTPCVPSGTTSAGWLAG